MRRAYHRQVVGCGSRPKQVPAAAIHLQVDQAGCQHPAVEMHAVGVCRCDADGAYGAVGDDERGIVVPCLAIKDAGAGIGGDLDRQSFLVELPLTPR